MAIPLLTRILKGTMIKALRQGALIVDVRTPQEYDGGKIPGSINIPLNQLAANARRLKDMKRPVITVCSNGSRALQAYHTLLKEGVNQVRDGGSWTSLLKLINKL